MKKILFVVTVLLTGLWAFGQNADEITKKAHLAAYYFGKDGRAQMLMKVYAKGAETPIKKMFYILRLNLEEGGEQMFYTYFVKPSDIKRTTFLVHKHINKDDYRRLYIPASDKVIPIAGNRKQDPFMGSDFTYEDVSGRHFSKDNHTLVGEEKMGGVDCYITESVPRKKEDKIAKMKSWIDKKTYIPMRVDFYNHDGKVYRKYEALSIQDIDGFPTVMVRVMTSPLEGTHTELIVNPKNVAYNVGLTKDIFTERSLKNPPAQYLK
jgi:outer membrane lipoprotein-sorting protein